MIRLFSGDADQDEKKFISEWLEQSAENKKLYADLREIWLSSGIESNADNFDLEGAILRFRKQINKAKLGERKPVDFNRVFKYAAILILALALPFSYYLGTRSNSDDSMTTISCAYGDKSSIILPDSSHVWLNSGSKLTFSSNFKNGRKVSLEGEAFFSVSKDKDHPFSVKAAEVEVKVLGTKFNLKAYPDEKSISTTLVEGSVNISSKYQQTLMKPDQKLIYNKESKKMEVQELTDTAPDTEWKDGRFVFRNESLAELKPKLERWFDVDIVFGDEPVKNRRFTGVLGRESILEAVSYFDLSNFVTCRIEGNKIIINSQNN
jgi:ferric-dicitrate binding protein FerR (iron transport regulator)